jgi:hypothetical protein
MDHDKDHKAISDRLDKVEKTLKALLTDVASASKVAAGVGKVERRSRT